MFGYVDNGSPAETGENANLQLFASKAACDKRKMAVSQSINNVLLHIPRTGGSSIWHSLVAAHDRIQCLVFDIYHTAVANFGASTRVREALESVAADSIAAGRRLYHHHSPDDIRDWLPPAKELKVATVMRDPVDRLVSNLVHLRAHFGEGALPAGMRDQILSSWTEPFQAAMLDPTASIDDLASIAGREPAFRNYYVAYLSTFLLGHRGSTEEPHPPITAALVDYLVETGRRRFCTVGRFENLAEAYREIASAFEIGGEIKHHINKSAERHKLSASTRCELRRAFAADYELMERLTASSTVSPSPLFQYVVPTDCNNIEGRVQDGMVKITVEDATRGGNDPAHASITLPADQACDFARWILAITPVTNSAASGAPRALPRKPLI